MAYDLSFHKNVLSRLQCKQLGAVKAAVHFQFAEIVSPLQRILVFLPVWVVLVEVKVGIEETQVDGVALRFLSHDDKVLVACRIHVLKG